MWRSIAVNDNSKKNFKVKCDKMKKSSAIKVRLPRDCDNNII